MDNEGVIYITMTLLIVIIGVIALVIKGYLEAGLIFALFGMVNVYLMGTIMDRKEEE